jgi:hypothetical protein
MARLKRLRKKRGRRLQGLKPYSFGATYVGAVKARPRQDEKNTGGKVALRTTQEHRQECLCHESFPQPVERLTARLSSSHTGCQTNSAALFMGRALQSWRSLGIGDLRTWGAGILCPYREKASGVKALLQVPEVRAEADIHNGGNPSLRNSRHGVLK